MKLIMLVMSGAALAASSVSAPGQPAAATEAPPKGQSRFPMVVAVPHGQIAIGSAAEELGYRDLAYAPARRVGDFVYVSGNLAGPQGPEGENEAAFREQTRRAFREVQTRLKALNSSLDDVISMHSFHVFHGPGYSGGKWDQFNTFVEVKKEFMHGPPPAWTAVGVDELLYSRGVVEFDMVAYSPLAKPAR